MFVLIFEYYTFENENTWKPCNQNYYEKKKQYKNPKQIGNHDRIQKIHTKVNKSKNS